MQSIEHSGRVWVSLGHGPSGFQLWPIDEFFARRKVSSSVQARIRRFYPNGKEEGSTVRGWYLKPLSWRRAKKKLQRGQGDRIFRCRLPGGKREWSWADGHLSRDMLMAALRG